VKTSCQIKRGDILNKAYLDIRDYLQRIRKDESDLSDYWQEESSSMEYMYNATPEIIARLRDHCHWISGVRSYEYKNHHAHDRKRFEVKYNQLKILAPNLPPVSEPKDMGGFGFEIDGSLINVDSLKFYESVVALELSGILSYLKRIDRPVIVEIGAGWGGFATAIKKLIPNCQYIVIDIPETLLFSGTYLGQIFPEQSKRFIEDFTIDPKEDLVFCAHTLLNSLKLTKVDLVINMVSFQEMTGSQIEEYAKWAKRSKTKFFYSHNKEKSKHNHQIRSIYDHLQILGVKNKIDVLPVDYTIINGHELNVKFGGPDYVKENKSGSRKNLNIYMKKVFRILLMTFKDKRRLKKLAIKIFDLFEIRIVVKKNIQGIVTPNLGYQHFYYVCDHE
jgi:putative sugar O-methyltransferase